MARTRSMYRKQNHDDDEESSSRKRFKTCNNGGRLSWSDLTHHVLYSVMMQLGVIDFLTFSGVCKSWRSLALCNKMSFMASTPPMLMWVYDGACNKECYYYLRDLESRRFKTLLPNSAGRNCVGLTCGYLVLFGRETKDFWLVNPITRLQFHFPNFPLNYVAHDTPIMKTILVFSPSISGWVFVILDKTTNYIWFSIAGKRTWNSFSSNFPILDMHAFKGKIYTIHKGCHVYEMRLNPEPKLTLLELVNFQKPRFSFPEFASSSENLYVIDYKLEDPYKVHELDLGKMELVLLEKTMDFFFSNLQYSVAIKPGSWADHQPLYERYFFVDRSRKYWFFGSAMQYFPHECMNVNLLDE